MSNHQNQEIKMESPLKDYIGAESPTTVRPFDMDDDDVQESSVGVNEALNSQGTVKIDDEPPPRPPIRPPRPDSPDADSPNDSAENTLKEAFPNIDTTIIKAILRASSGKIEPAFNALLGMSDPEAAQELSNPAPPSNPVPTTGFGSTPLSQLEADERYARQLAEQYRYNDTNIALRSPVNNSRGELAPGSGRQPNLYEERSFLEDELPIIKDNLKKGFLETQNKVSSWINILKKKIDGDDDSDRVPQKLGTTSRLNNDDGARKSDDFSPYDADPQVLSDDFAGIQMNSDGTLASQSTKVDKSQFKSIPIHPKNPHGYQPLSNTTIPEENKLPKTLSNPEDKSPSNPKTSKWQPLSMLEPNPASETDNDPFSLGDTDDEKETKDRIPSTEIKQGMTEVQKISTKINIIEHESNRTGTTTVN